MRESERVISFMITMTDKRATNLVRHIHTFIYTFITLRGYFEFSICINKPTQYFRNISEKYVFTTF